LRRAGLPAREDPNDPDTLDAHPLVREHFGQQLRERFADASLGRAHLAETRRDETRNFSTAAEHLDQAVDGLRQAGMQEYISRGLLARAALYRIRREFEPARRDLDEALSIAERGQMGLYRADAHLESARLDLAMANKPEAREHLATAKEMIERMGYHRRDGEVVELEERLKAG